VDFDLSDEQRSCQARGRALGRELTDEASAADVVSGAARAGRIDHGVDLLAAAAAVDALAAETAGSALALALHLSVVLATSSDGDLSALARGERVGAIGLSTDQVPDEVNGVLSGRASWVGPLTDHGLGVVGARRGGELCAYVVALDAPGVKAEVVSTGALSGFVWGHLALAEVPASFIGSPLPIMARVRVLLAAAGLGMGRRALREALEAARGYRGRGAGGEQTVQGLLADAATELDAATLLTWKAASAPTLSLADASMAKLAATEATQHAVARATQVVGADSFRRGHVVERLAQDVRALELFAGRTEALREAVADEILPRA
jgi:alkylation response protein AidB-like acyl-CoA dehydrogenase